MLEKIKKNKTYFSVNFILMIIALSNLWLAYTDKYINISLALCISNLLICLMYVNHAIQHKKEGKRKEFKVDIFCCIIFIVLTIFIYCRCYMGWGRV